jgi:cobalt-zinc-cadmium efflux system outer membrane protein
VADGYAVQAGLRLNPRLIMQSENWSFTGAPLQGIPTFTDQFLYLSQILETGGKRERRVDVGQAGVALAGLDRTLLERQITTRVKFAYWEALGTRRILELWREDEANFAQTIQYHQDRVREGAMAEGDLLKVRLEAGRVSVAASSAALDVERAEVALLREMGQSEMIPLRLTGDLSVDTGVPPEIDMATALEARTEARIAHQSIVQAKANLNLQHANARPDVEVLAGYKRTAGFNTAMWGLQFNLPVRNKNQGNIAAAGSAVRAAEYSLTATENLIRSEVATARKEAEARRGQLTGILATSLQQAEESLRIARAAYLEGGTDLLRLLDSERVHIELEVLNARTQMEYRQSLVALEAALGQYQ